MSSSSFRLNKWDRLQSVISSSSMQGQLPQQYCYYSLCCWEDLKLIETSEEAGEVIELILEDNDLQEWPRVWWTLEDAAKDLEPKPEQCAAGHYERVKASFDEKISQLRKAEEAA